ncbi:MAG TPA: hypothetical protein DEB25_02040 [Desulfobulbaceae bacterium]|nr:hypothetical protein [Desulfobulbaceae bacterium]
MTSSSTRWRPPVKITTRSLLVLAIGFTVLLAACSPVRVSQDYLPSTDFATIHSYGWRFSPPPVSPDPRITDPLLRQRFHDAIDQTLNERGFQRTERPDILVDFTYSIISRLDSDQFGFSFGGYRDYGAFYGSAPIIEQYDVSLLYIDIYDASGKQLLWRGRGSEILTTYKNPAELTAAVNRMVAAILARFPPSP